MKKSHFIVQVSIVALLVFCAGIVGASASVVTVFPGTAAVNVTQPNGQVVRMTGNFPIQPGAVMQANGGPVVVRGPGFTFTALKNTRFSLAKSEGKFCLLPQGKEGIESKMSEAPSGAQALTPDGAYRVIDPS